MFVKVEKSKIILEVKDMERLQKVIAHAGVASRRKAEELIKEGKVKVNGKVVTELGVKVTGSDQIEVNGLKVEREEPVTFSYINQEALFPQCKMIKDAKW